MQPGVVIPVKAFAAAKARLADVLSPDDRQRLAMSMCARVIAAAHDLPVIVVCDDRAVADWATERGARISWQPGAGLNGALNATLDELRRGRLADIDHVVIAHSDLPLIDDLRPFAVPSSVVLVPDQSDNGTNVLAMPVGAPLRAAYGPWSFARHLVMAEASGLAVRVVRDTVAALDVDEPGDLTTPLIEAFVRSVVA